MKKEERCLSNPYAIQCINHIVGRYRKPIRSALNVKPFTSCIIAARASVIIMQVGKSVSMYCVTTDTCVLLW